MKRKMKWPKKVLALTLAASLTVISAGVDGVIANAAETESGGTDIVDPPAEPVEKYHITVDNMNNGTVTVEVLPEEGDTPALTDDADAIEAAKDAEVKITATPSESYTLKSISVIQDNESKEEVEIKEVSKNVRTFKMPEAPVKISAVFGFNGWETISGKKYYYINGDLQKGFEEIGKYTYYFDSKGVMLTGLQNIGKYKYYFDTKGIMKTGLQTIGKYKYLFDKNGRALKGWQTISKYKYYFDPSTCRMATGFKTIGKSKYYFYSNGKRSSGWKTISGSKYYLTSDGRLTIGWKTYKGARYYFASNGKMTKGFKKIGKYVYYFSSAGKLQKNTIVGSKSQGYYYVDSYGVRVTTKEVKQAVSFVRKYTKTSWSKSKKLQACYKALWKKYPYKRYYDKPSAKKMASYANSMFTQRKGNCYRYASSFAYIAKVLGYDSRVAVGKISHRGGGMTPHGWAEIKVGKKWYMCDANMQRNFPKINSYMRTNKNYAYRHSCSKRYKMTVKYGKVTWK